MTPDAAARIRAYTAAVEAARRAYKLTPFAASKQDAAGAVVMAYGRGELTKEQMQQQRKEIASW